MPAKNHAYTTVAYWAVHGDPDNMDRFLDEGESCTKKV